ncbi:XRE family transcriptional regulator [Tessaracoccus caeni]|uniref:XRE family transcriptional regulator n=1 Tax=Tessaracoccus caeni TaxID=3031239 RepID=UPI0023DA0796|nr:XRE family transcriptional regulator [Tessaracoccus caeni]MDF1489866.1 helix-turn-helix domain-containing protein [Tessaracoccus caeni]
MTNLQIAERLVAIRTAAGLSQRELAARSGVPQPNIAAYESGRRRPTSATIERLESATRVPTLDRLRRHRDAIAALAAARRLTDVRVFGSVARGEAEEGSDLDLLVHPTDQASIFDLAGFMAEAEGLLGVPVDVVSDRGSGPTMDHIRKEAVPL